MDKRVRWILTSVLCKIGVAQGGVMLPCCSVPEEPPTLFSFFLSFGTASIIPS
ncbi:hypothetical protein M404DRAFT_999369 [Pisolithus tinctorius Marx 270]|uniref:Uncharacterized protein n=1 Tax=Pisolithus tinctorius Marx 270 TaxID=870435 RepID=A0A0C3PDD6_PISTI|nr:hypothetical protein M404DRAFT_999369 [Pisolithus tinctorius Marx 270]